jgi:hypothetical protein
MSREAVKQKSRASGGLVLRIESPPETRGRPAGKSRPDEMLNFVRAAAGQWCRVLERDSHASANAIAARWRVRFASEGYEFKLRRIAVGQKQVAVVYARFAKVKE